MPTFDFTLGGSTGISDDKVGKAIVLEREIDFAHADYAGVVGSDIVQLLNVPINFVMTQCAVRVITAAGAALTCTVGDGVDPNGWLAAVDLNVLATTLSNLDLAEAAPPTFVDAFMGLGGKHYAAADTIDIVVSDVMLLCKLKIFALGYMVD
jgi:hypothetical protein